MRGIKRVLKQQPVIRLAHKPKINRINRINKERERAAKDREPGGAGRLKVSGGTGGARN